MASVIREQFKIRSELEVVHIPTGAVFSAYPYSNPDEIGTTRARVSHFMNKFRQLGFIDYNGGIAVHSSLLNLVLLHDQPQIKIFMNKFHQLGFIDYNGGIAVHSSLLNAVLHDQPQIKI
jgi:hypothetical protein